MIRVILYSLFFLLCGGCGLGHATDYRAQEIAAPGGVRCFVIFNGDQTIGANCIGSTSP